MNRFLLQSCFVLITVLFLIPQETRMEFSIQDALHVKKLGVDYDYVYCLLGDHVVDRVIPVRDFSKWNEGKGGGTLGDFEVNYTGFTQEAQDAFQYAVDIWDMLLDSEAKIVVDANFADLNSGVLGSAAPSAMYANFSDKVDAHIEYAAPLADKIAGYSLNGNEADLRCNFNRSTNWFYDFNNTNNIADNQTDFVSTVLHELGHGLGFLSRNTTVTTDGLGFIRSDDEVVTDIFSLLLEHRDGTNLILNHEDASIGLGENLTSGDIFLNTHSFPIDALPEIFAPDPWQGGASLSHLDETVYNPTDPLMTPFIGKKEVIHDPEIALDMMNDMGWRSSFIGHRSANTEVVSQPLPISARIFTDAGVGFDSALVQLIYSKDSFRLTSEIIRMEFSDADGLFHSELPADNTTGRYQYYISLSDDINNGYSSPLLAPRRYHDIQIGIDDDPPSIVHTPVEFYFLNEGAPLITGRVTDSFTGVDSVVMEYKINGGALESIGLASSSSDGYELIFDIDLSSISDGDIIEYRLVARDQSMASNVVLDPLDGFHAMEVKDVPSEVNFYLNDFEGSDVDFSTSGFSTRSESGFDGAGLHSEHPYANAGAGNELNFTAQLRVPIKIANNGIIEFDEVVLVEPGETGESFGSGQFWDYVIVEASKDDGSSWIPLADGYDSNDNATWSSRYDSGIVGQNSTSTGDKALLQKRIINLHQPALGLNVGDVVILRWRLYSDAFATGWGWMIDNLIIQGDQNTTPVVDYDKRDDLITVFPNPVINNQLSFIIKGDIAVRRIMIFDSNGRLVSLNEEAFFSNEQKQVDISNLSSGVYFALFHSDKEMISKRFLKL